MNEQLGTQKRKSVAFSRTEAFKRSDPEPEPASMGPPLAWLAFYVIAVIGGLSMSHTSDRDVAGAKSEVAMRW